MVFDAFPMIETILSFYFFLSARTPMANW